MSYLIKSPITSNVKFAHVYMNNNGTYYTVNASSSIDFYSSFNGIVSSTGISLTLSNGNVVLGNKNYIVYITPCLYYYHPTGATIGLFDAYSVLYLNSNEISNQIYGGKDFSNKYPSLTSNSVANYVTSNIVGYCSFIANSGDILSLRNFIKNQSTSTSYVQEIGQSGFSSNSQTYNSSHSIFIWEIDK